MTKRKWPAPARPVTPPPKSKNTFSSEWIWLGLLIIIPYIVYSACSRFDLLDWDEKSYIFETPMIQNLTWENIRLMFAGKVLSSYNPLVLLSFALDYHFAQTSPAWYHSVNVVFHILNGLLLFFCIRALNQQVFTAGIVAMLFAIHPMHVESVAWVASRKDVVFGFFFFISWLSYLSFYRKKNYLWYGFSLLFFAFSLLSKSQAVTLPLVLLLTDYYLSREWKWSYLVNKIPFFLFSMVIGYVAVAGSTFVADKYSLPLTFFDRIMYSGIALAIYTWKLIIPLSQSAIYAFPPAGSSDYITGLAGALLILATLTWLVIRFNKKQPLIVFGILFFLINTFLVLHVVAVNSSLIYERFTYISYIGLFFVAASLPEIIPSQKNQIRGGLLIVLSLFAILCYNRTTVWKNTETLFTDVIEKNPMSVEAYTNRGQYYNDRGELDKAKEDFTNGIKANPRHPNTYCNRAVVYFKKHDYARAIADNDSALKIEPELLVALVNRGDIYFNLLKYDSAIYYYNIAIAKTPNYAKAYLDRGSAYIQKGMPDSAIQDYKKAIEIFPGFVDAYKYLSIAYVRKDDLAEAEKYMNSARSLDPNSDAGRDLCGEYLKKGNEAYQNGDSEKAMKYYEEASRIMPENAEPYYNMGGLSLMRKDIPAARRYWQKTLELNPNHKEAREWLQKTGG